MRGANFASMLFKLFSSSLVEHSVGSVLVLYRIVFFWFYLESLNFQPLAGLLLQGVLQEGHLANVDNHGGGFCHHNHCHLIIHTLCAEYILISCLPWQFLSNIGWFCPFVKTQISTSTCPLLFALFWSPGSPDHSNYDHPDHLIYPISITRWLPRPPQHPHPGWEQLFSHTWRKQLNIRCS